MNGTEEVFPPLPRRRLTGRGFAKGKPKPAPGNGRLGRLWRGSHLSRTSLCGLLCQDFFWQRFSASLSGSLCLFKNQDATVVQMDFGCFPCGALVEPVWVRLIWIPGTVEPVEIRFFVGDPFLDRLQGWFDRLHGVDVEGRRRGYGGAGGRSNSRRRYGRRRWLRVCHRGD